MSFFELENKSFDYYTALVDIAKFVERCKERGWTYPQIVDAVEALGREGEERMDQILKDMNERLNTGC